ncbi:hypothetical protein [Streptomyces sp. LaPpAH-108]|uniref:hypothetical protein n=1 Tax=Streptomyces sp. LaPpAH-108 TaxID=1155714 RepID=UPI00039DEBA3|nr:hypothetical protein [Streptomyces sp. LaPpAH-108]
MDAEKTSRFVRLQVELILEVTDEDELTQAAVNRLAGDPEVTEAERAHAESAVTEDTEEALASLVDPFSLVSGVPGVELQQASWSSEQIDYDPDSPEWDLGEDDRSDDDEEDGIG